MKNFAKKYGNVIIFACVFVVGVIARPGAFLSISNVTGIISQAAIAAICCLGMTFVLMTGGIDLSVGYCWGSVPMSSDGLLLPWGFPLLQVSC